MSTKTGNLGSRETIPPPDHGDRVAVRQSPVRVAVNGYGALGKRVAGGAAAWVPRVCNAAVSPA